MSEQQRRGQTKTITKKRAARRSGQFRVGKVQADLRGSVWYLSYHEHEQGQRRRPRVGPDKDVARQLAVQINGQLEVGAPAALSFEPISLVELRASAGWHVMSTCCDPRCRPFDATARRRNI